MSTKEFNTGTVGVLHNAGRKKTIALATLVPVVLMTLGAQQLAAHPPAPNPSMDVDDLTIEWADEQTAEGYTHVENVSGEGNSVWVESGFLSWQWIGRRGVRADCPTVSWVTNLPLGTELLDGEPRRVDFVVECLDPAPFEPREIKIFGCVKLEVRTKLFCASGGYELGN